MSVRASDSYAVVKEKRMQNPLAEELQLLGFAEFHRTARPLALH
jgi:hypothetical protein